MVLPLENWPYPQLWPWPYQLYLSSTFLPVRIDS